MTTIYDVEATVMLTAVTCTHSGCGLTFGLDRKYVAARQQDHETFYCPNGHGRCYRGRSDIEQARAERDAAQSLARRERERRVTTEYQRRAAVGQVTKIKKRVGNGVCPCCNRTFAALARHMQGQHPDFTGGSS
jgi:hypothetical protein